MPREIIGAPLEHRPMRYRHLLLPLIAVLATSAAADPAAGRKFHPGHYLSPYMGDGHEQLRNRVGEVCREPALKGLELRVPWADLERDRGDYTFGDIEDLYQRLAVCHKTLFLEIWVANFKGQPQGIVPSYLESKLARTRTGYVAEIWDPAVMDPFIALHQALAKRFDAEPYFEGVILTETATSGVAAGYTPAAYIEQLTRAARALRAAWQRSEVLVFANFIQGSSDGEFRSFVDALDSIGVGIGGPDVFPPPIGGSKGEKVYRGEIGGRDFRADMLAGFSVQTPELGGARGTFTPTQLFAHCVDTNRCKYMFWARNTSTGGPEQRWETGILPFIRAHASF